MLKDVLQTFIWCILINLEIYTVIKLYRAINYWARLSIFHFSEFHCNLDTPKPLKWVLDLWTFMNILQLCKNYCFSVALVTTGDHFFSHDSNIKPSIVSLSVHVSVLRKMTIHDAYWCLIMFDGAWWHLMTIDGDWWQLMM